jgi:Ca2+-binding RTX toxin-like protein
MPTITGTNNADTITIFPFFLSAGANITNAAVPPLPHYEISGLGGNDILHADNGNDKLFGGSGKDDLNGGLGDDIIEGGIGNDKILGGGGIDNVKGGAGDDNITSSGSGTYDGGDDDDTIRTSSTTPETVNGGAGTADLLDLLAILDDTTVDLSNGANTFSKIIQGFERLRTGPGSDNLTGTDGKNDLESGDGDDVLDGGKGADDLSGGKGEDALSGGAGADVLSGGADADVFVFEDGDSSPPSSRDRILDFEQTVDLLDLTSLSGTLTFGENLTAKDSNTNTIISGDADNDDVIDFEVIVVDGAVTAANWSGADFIF